MNLPSRARSPRTTGPSRSLCLANALRVRSFSLNPTSTIAFPICSLAGIQKSAGLVLVVKRHFARNEIAIHADDEGLHFHFVLDTLLNQIHLPREFAPADREQIHLSTVADAGQPQREVVEKNSIRQRASHHGRQPQ